MRGYQALREKAAWIDLSARGKIVARGEDRARLLHAMTTNHVQQLEPGGGCYAFFLNAQGRILGDVNLLCRRLHAQEEQTTVHSRKYEPPLRFGNRTPQFAGRFHPFGDNHLDVGERFLACGAICRAASQLRHFGDECTIFAAPIQDDFVFRHFPSSASLY